MIGAYFLRNGELLPVAQATVPLDDVNYAYGYGVYETLKIRDRILYFPEAHEDRLFHSAAVIGLDHPFRSGEIVRGIRDLAAANRIPDATVKVLLTGGAPAEGAAGARCDAMLLPAITPDPGLYEEGATAITFDGERHYPASKSLSMTMSTVAFRQAQRLGAYDAVLVNRDGFMTEGTRTNLFAVLDGAVVTPPREQCLDGVTRESLLEVVRELGLPLREEPLPRSLVESGSPRLEGLLLSSTSTKLLPLRELDGWALPLPERYPVMARAYDDYLTRYARTQKPLY